MTYKIPKISEEILLPNKGECAAILFEKFKTAALCYDRIWSPNEVNVPKYIRCFGGTSNELDFTRILKKPEIMRDKLEKLFKAIKSSVKNEKEITASNVGFSEVEVNLIAPLFNAALKGELTSKDMAQIEHVISNIEEYKNKDLNGSDKIVRRMKEIVGMIAYPTYRAIAKSFYEKYKITMVPIYESEEKRDSEYNEGDRKAVVIALSNLRIADENRLTWEQVTEFRKDKKGRGKYKRFLHWLDKELLGKSQAFLEDEISQRLEDYEWALKKHGIKTVLGTIDETLDGKYLIGASGAALAGYPIWGLLGAGLLIGGKVAAKLIQTKLDFEDIERGPNSEISWVYEVKQLQK